MHDMRRTKPRLGFIGLGRIGQKRMQSVLDSDAAEIVAVADPDGACLAQVRAALPRAVVCRDIDALLEENLDGLVIATPNALHGAQAIAALEAGVAVFCQKPLAATAGQARVIVDHARRNDRLLGVDLSYRYLYGMQRIKQLMSEGALGDVYALQLSFHNAFGPDKPWFYRRESAGGGCVLDLGVHLIDLALWVFDYPVVERVTGRCYAGGELLPADDGRLNELPVEDYASLQLVLANGATVDISCSWHLPLGRSADIQAEFYGTRGGAGVRNVAGSFFDFRSELHDGCTTQVLYEPAQEGPWSGRAIVGWARQLAADGRFDAASEGVVVVAEAIDAIYATRDTAPVIRRSPALVS
ncbi:Gfo/Idh/MocA family oxidoreductase [Salinisphaera sp.]|uniref:Gfo/Idh/MocA family protein n=1 Tax=Salinisphaera sp. TaxID=1914330 RepID=UPI002D77BA65|nr:Gfo/Idh/MocA family oxidoreductase [Salinisphaera sp.]HET7315751.1 Gfo/Idh/MocA family oxidoreductase [Salinisphaera sp.]